MRYSGFGEPTNAYTYFGNGDVFVSKLNNDLTYFTSGVVFGGSGTSYANAIATDQQNYIYITGATNATDFPAIQLANTYPNNGMLINKGDYAFVVKLSCQYLENVESVALLGGSARDTGNGIAVDPVGRVYVVGGTWSQDFQPIVSQQKSSNNGKENAFVTILDKELQTVNYSIYLGGNSNDVANGIVVSGLGPNFGVVRTTNSTNFSGVTSSPAYNGNEDVFFSVIKNPNTAQQTQDTSIIGGANADYGNCAAMTSSGQVYVAGNTWSNDYPTTIGAYDNFAHNDLGYTKDAYVTEIDNFVDNEAPVVTKADPVNNAVNVSLNKVINLVFNEPIKEGANFSRITLSSNNGGTVPAIVKITGNSLVVVPMTNYLKGTIYTLYLPTDAIEDMAGNAASSYTTKFTTIPAVQVKNSDPANNAVNVALTKVIKVVYSDSIPAGANFEDITLRTINGAVGISKTVSDKTLIITPLTNLIGGSTYTLNIPYDAIEDLTSNPAASYTAKFTTNPPLQVTSSDPANNAVSVPVTKTIKITFNKQIYSGSAYNQITLKNSSNTAIGITKSISGNVLTITKTSGTFAGGLYTLTLPVNSIVDVNSSSILSGYITKFTVDSTKPTITSMTPTKNVAGVPVNSTITVNFSKAIKIGPAAISIKSSTGKVIAITNYKIINGGKTLVLYHTANFAKGTKYTIYFQNGSITDLANNYLAAYSSSFTTKK